MTISKKILSIVLLLVMISTTCIFNVNASNTKITETTIITQNNISKVFKYLGIKPSKKVKTKNFNKQKYTVNKLRNIIEQQRKNNSELIKSESYSNNVVLNKSNAVKGQKKVSYLSKYSTYQIRYYVTGKYYKNKKKKYWTNVVDWSVKFKDTSATDICYNEFEETSSYTK